MPKETLKARTDLALDIFCKKMKQLEAPEIIEIGSRADTGEKNAEFSRKFPNAARYVGVDYLDGPGVDVVADAHRLTQTFEPESFDGVVSLATFEHIAYPWLAALEMAKVAKQGGFILVHTLQTFALHGAPYDYWRFSAKGMRTLFPRSMGLEEVYCGYTHPCLILSREDPDQAHGKSYLSISILLKKVGETPAEFPYDFDI